MANAPEPAPVPGDAKDWTWVLSRACDECGFDATTVQADEVADLLLANAGGWKDVLARPDVAERPQPDVWSPLEYACHVRDVFALYDVRLHLMLAENDPEFPNWDQDETAVTERYWAQDPKTVAEQLDAAAQRLAASFRAVRADQWDRPGRRSDGAAFTVDTFARYLVHDPIHHLHDVG